MQESQDIEWKEKWKDDYLKWICGFANAKGGKIIIGKNDKGEIIGLQNSKKLLEDIPNKVRDILGIMVDVNLHKTEKGDFLEIIVDPQPFPVNYKGQYHYRSGSTKQELKGAALDKFMLEKKGKKWDGVPVQISVYDDKLMIWNYGQLPTDWTIDNLKQKHSSIPYNPDISNAFFRAGYIEAWGRGTIKIIEQCKEYGLPNPEFENTGKDFWVVFKKDIINKENLEKLQLNERQVKAVLFIKEKGKISNKEYQELCKVSKGTATKELRELIEKFNLLERKGNVGAGTFYVIK